MSYCKTKSLCTMREFEWCTILLRREGGEGGVAVIHNMYSLWQLTVRTYVHSSDWQLVALQRIFLARCSQKIFMIRSMLYTLLVAQPSPNTHPR